MNPYLPTLRDLFAIGIAWLIMAILHGGGTAILSTHVDRRPDVSVVLGWGAWCVIATLWTVLTPYSLVWPAMIFSLVAMISLVVKPDRKGWAWLARALVVSLPLWLVLSPVRPAEPDTWLNLLPNANYLVDHGVLPVAGGPPSYSFLPAAPYNTQFLSYLGGLLDPSYPAAGMSLDNLILLIVAGMVIARLLNTGRDSLPGWSLTALGILLATLLNPGFVPRIHLAAYGETGLAVTALVAAVLFVELPQSSNGLSWRGMVAIGLALAAMVNVKQSGFGLVAAVASAALVTLFADRRQIRAFWFVLGSLIVPVMLALSWRWFVAHAGVDELKPLPLAEWQWRNIPAILASMARTASDKGLYFGCVFLSIAALPVLYRRDGWTMTTRLLSFNLALFTCYTSFLVLTYIGHFPGAWSTEAHSFYRYETHLSLVLMLSLSLAARDLLASVQPMLGARLLPAAVIILLVAPLAFARMLRFDLAMPQPLVWNVAKALAPLLDDDSRLALLLPGDNGSVATMLAGVLRDTAPRRRSLDLHIIDHADALALDEAAAANYQLAFISCTPFGLTDVPAGHAALLAFAQGEWRPRAVWDYPAAADHSRWQHILAWEPLCRTS